jgi:hypothetical protein
MFDVINSRSSEIYESNERYVFQSKRSPKSNLFEIFWSNRENKIPLVSSVKNLEAHTFISEWLENSNLPGDCRSAFRSQKVISLKRSPKSHARFSGEVSSKA